MAINVCESIETLVKTPSEQLSFSWDFTELVNDGETLSSVVSITLSAPTLSVGAGSISGLTVRATITDGIAGTDYVCSCIVQTNAGNRHEIRGRLQVRQ